MEAEGIESAAEPDVTKSGKIGQDWRASETSAPYEGDGKRIKSIRADSLTRGIPGGWKHDGKCRIPISKGLQ